MDKAVHKVIKKEIIIINHAPKSPALPTTQPNLRYMITPKMVRKVGVKTPPKVPNFLPAVVCCSISYKGSVWSRKIVIIQTSYFLFSNKVTCYCGRGYQRAYGIAFFSIELARVSYYSLSSG